MPCEVVRATGRFLCLPGVSLCNRAALRSWPGSFGLCSPALPVSGLSDGQPESSSSCRITFGLVSLPTNGEPDRGKDVMIDRFSAPLCNKLDGTPQLPVAVLVVLLGIPEVMRADGARRRQNVLDLDGLWSVEEGVVPMRSRGPSLRGRGAGADQPGPPRFSRRRSLRDP